MQLLVHLPCCTHAQQPVHSLTCLSAVDDSVICQSTFSKAPSNTKLHPVKTSGATLIA